MGKINASKRVDDGDQWACVPGHCRHRPWNRGFRGQLLKPPREAGTEIPEVHEATLWQWDMASEDTAIGQWLPLMTHSQALVSLQWLPHGPLPTSCSVSIVLGGLHKPGTSSLEHSVPSMSQAQTLKLIRNYLWVQLTDENDPLEQQKSNLRDS